MRKPLKLSVWFSVIIVAVFIVAWLWIRESSKFGPYNLEPVSTFRNGNSAVNEEPEKLRVCPDNWFEFLSPIPAKSSPYYGQEGQFLIINGSADLIPAEKFDLEWIKQNCEIKEPKQVG